jgi:hypothetical protein
MSASVRMPGFNRLQMSQKFLMLIDLFIIIPRNPYTGIIHGYRNSQRVRTWLYEAKSVIRQTVQCNSKYKQKITKQKQAQNSHKLQDMYQNMAIVYTVISELN